MDVKHCDRCGAVYDADYGKNERGTNFVLLTDRKLATSYFKNMCRYRFVYEARRLRYRICA